MLDLFQIFILFIYLFFCWKWDRVKHFNPDAIGQMAEDILRLIELAKKSHITYLIYIMFRITWNNKYDLLQTKRSIRGRRGGFLLRLRIELKRAELATAFAWVEINWVRYTNWDDDAPNKDRRITNWFTHYMKRSIFI